jgi:hypothetical protein
MIKSRRMKWEEHVALTGEKINAFKVLVGKQKKRDHFKVLSVDDRVIVKLMLKKQGGRVWTGFSWLRKGNSVILL